MRTGPDGGRKKGRKERRSVCHMQHRSPYMGRCGRKASSKSSSSKAQTPLPKTPSPTSQKCSNGPSQKIERHVHPLWWQVCGGSGPRGEER